MNDRDWATGIDPSRASVARVYDYLLGGAHNFSADRDIARTLEAIEPQARAIAAANRAFLVRAVRFLAAEAGVRQFLDIGSGIPTQGNVHEIVRGVAPDARVVYVDRDPVAVAHSTALLDGDPNAAVVQADLTRPADILGHPTVRKMIDFGEPVGLLLVAVLHFITDEQDPRGVLAELTAPLAPGSHLAVSHGTHKQETGEAVTKVYRRAVAQGEPTLRTPEEIGAFFTGFDLLDPGLVHGPLWRPDSPGDVPDDPSRFWFLVGVGRKP
ncbi:SAM-dependent methyltransferase [Actinomadura verrucosospora]|uniref:Methyltransf_19 domain containing protein n=1 Tax=Actinomadura verrucosospora TaxID=46165 RepID=A0A7D3VQC5_ACTVE|nr:SAM-dependent methyltransferase [Actinomadura verrucosospora]QKG20240.1 methyltransf_19 domain containing protein [Actinomadura verrucosospora]